MARETKALQQEREKARENLREFIKPGTTIYTVSRHTSRSGIYRAIDAFVMRDGEPVRISFQVAKACGLRYDRKHEAIGMGGCGMDMGFALVYDLSYYLAPGGFGCIGEGCPSNDHSNGDRSYVPHSDASRRVLYHDRTEHPRHEYEAIGDWAPGRAPTGAKVFLATDGRRLYLFDDEVDSDEEHTGAHWHTEGGYALRHRWL